MRARLWGVGDLVKPDTDVQQSLTGHSVKLWNASRDRSPDSSGIVRVKPAVIPASPRADLISPDGIAADVATGSLASVPRMIEARQVSAHPILDELEQLIDSAWTRYEVERTGAAAAQGPSKVVAPDVGYRSARSVTTAANGQQPALTPRPSQLTSTVASEVITGKAPDRATQVMLQHLDTLLDTFMAADPTSQAQSERGGESTPTDTRSATR